jgi:serine phosphatase RsbU (regulator of sigma subunit)
MLFMHFLRNICVVPAFSSTHMAIWLSDHLRQAIHWPFRMSAFDVVGLVEMYAVLVILLRSYVRSRSDEERMESELEAARAVQKVLIPDEIPTIPGFAVETVYHPASQVGGDFFQIAPVKTGGALIVIGDVSGKGMPAAMTVSLLVGTVRTLAHYTQSPGEILAAMNQRMLSRSSGGFTTCLVMRVDPDGTLAAANAGHLAPYLNGVELKLENGLPLGLAADTQYVESAFRLAAPARLTLITDGVVEARNHGGELFGFERTAAVSCKSADQIAKTAEQFGQEDDITVLTLTLAAVEALHA